MASSLPLTNEGGGGGGSSSSSLGVKAHHQDPEILYTKLERIGKGSFGEVFKGIDNNTKQVTEALIFHLYDHGTEYI